MKRRLANAGRPVESYGLKTVVLAVLPILLLLPVGHRITYKLCLTTWKTLHTSQPLYLSELISHYLPPRYLRSSNTNLLPDHPLVLATFPLGPFLCLHLVLGILYLHTFVLSTPYPPLNVT